MLRVFCLVVACSIGSAVFAEDDILDIVSHGFANNGDVRIHYVTAGEGPLVIMLHGFPDYWYSWRDQIQALRHDFRVVAVDLRGYNQSDQPPGVAEYAMPVLMSDVIAVMDHLKEERAIIVGNDWGGVISWCLAMYYPQRVDRLIICNMPHPQGFTRELRENADQRKSSAYASRFQEEDAAASMTTDQLVDIVASGRDAAVRSQYRQAFQRSSIQAMLNYYQANFPNASSTKPAPAAALPPVKCPVLMIHGLRDKALLSSGLNQTWDWVENELTILTLPDAAHFVQQDAPRRVNRAMLTWLRD